MKDNPQILIISSADPFVGPGRLSLDALKAFKNMGYDCDLLTKYRVRNHPEILYVKRRIFPSHSYVSKIFNRLSAFVKILQGQYVKLYYPYCFFYKDEEVPPVNADRIVSKIKKKYDLVLVLFWQEMLSFKSIETIYDRLNCQFQFISVDFSPMSGGCHFFGNCNRYKIGCGCCIALNSSNPKDFTYRNVQYRKTIYEKIKPIVYGNTYMKHFYSNSYLLKNYERIDTLYPIINDREFRYIDDKTLRLKYGIPNSKDFIIFFGCQSVSDSRKGMTYLLDSLDIIYSKLGSQDKDKVHLLIAGRSIESIKKRIHFSYSYVNFVPISQLPELYSLAHVFVSPSINDAGPMMVNQSIMCGTPVVGFEIGSILDVIKDKGTGYCAKYKNTEDLASCIYKIFILKKDHYNDYVEMRNKCRSVALETSSPQAFVDRILKNYYFFR